MAAAVAVAASGASANAQAAEGRARQATHGADGGGVFGAILSQLFPDNQPTPTQDEAAQQQSTLNVQQAVQSATQNNGALAQSGTPSNRMTEAAQLALAVQAASQNSLTAGDPVSAQPVAQTAQTAGSTASSPAPTPPGQSSIPPGQLQKLLKFLATTGQTAGNSNLNSALQSLLSGNTNAASMSANAQANRTSSNSQSASGSPTVNLSDPTTLAALMQALATQQTTGSETVTTAPQQPGNANSAVTAATAPVAANGAATALTGTPPAPANATANSAATALMGTPPAPANAAANSAATPLTGTSQAPANAAANASIAPALTNAERQLFVQTSHNALHQNTSAPVTEAKSLPINQGSTTTNTASGNANQSGGQQTNNGWSDAKSPQQQSASSSDAGSNANVPSSLPLAHDTNGAQQNAPTTSNSPAPLNASALASTQAGAPQQPAAALQVGPASQSADSLPPQTVQAIAVSIASQSQAGARQFNIRLDPPELGRVDVRLMVDATGKAQAHLAADKPQTLELLQRDSDSLTRALKDSGVQLNNNGLQFSLKGQDRQGSWGGGEPRGRSLAITATPTTASSTTNISSSLLPASASGVDIRV